MAFAIVCSSKMQAQDKQSINGYLVPMCIYNGDTIPCVQLRTVYIFRPLKFKNEKERLEYYRLVRNVKKVYPISKEINQAIIETYEDKVNQICPFSTSSTTLSVSLSSPNGSYSFFRLAPNSAANV